MIGLQSKHFTGLFKCQHGQLFIYNRSYLNGRNQTLLKNPKTGKKFIHEHPKASLSRISTPSRRPKILYIIPGIAVCLGLWQIHRRDWKLNLIHELQTKVNFPPMDLPKDITSGIDLVEYQPIKVKGTFDHSKEILIGPITFNPDFDRMNQKTSGDKKKKQKTGIEPRGYHVVTPLNLDNSKVSILINRGWVPEEQKTPDTRKNGQITNSVEVIGLVRHGSPGSSNSRTGIYNLRNIEEMAEKTGSLPIFLEANYDSSILNGPVGGQTLINLRNNHFEYSIFWFTLAAAITAFIKFSK